MEVSVTGYKLAQKIKGFGINYTDDDADEDRWSEENYDSYAKINTIVAIVLAILMIFSCSYEIFMTACCIYYNGFSFQHLALCHVNHVLPWLALAVITLINCKNDNKWHYFKYLNGVLSRENMRYKKSYEQTQKLCDEVATEAVKAGTNKEDVT